MTQINSWDVLDDNGMTSKQNRVIEMHAVRVLPTENGYSSLCSKPALPHMSDMRMVSRITVAQDTCIQFLKQC